MRLIMPRGPDHPISLEEWSEFRETVGTCQREMGDLLNLVEEDPLMALFRELTGNLNQYKELIPSPIMTVSGRPAEKEEEPREPQQPQ